MERPVLVLEEKLLLHCCLTAHLSTPICSSQSDGSFNCSWKNSASLNFLLFFSLQCIFSFPSTSVPSVVKTPENSSCYQ